MSRAAIILAAGAGTRMKSQTAEGPAQGRGPADAGPCHRRSEGGGGRPHRGGDRAGRRRRARLCRAARAAKRRAGQQLGTGHAAAAAGDALKDFDGELMIAYGDMPLMTAATFEASFAARRARGWPSWRSVPPIRRLWPGAAGRDGTLDRIVEFKDASEAERKTDLCNAGVLAADARKFFAWAGRLDNKNAQGEFYLTDIPALAKRDGVRLRRRHGGRGRRAGRQQPRRTGGGRTPDAGPAAGDMRWRQAWA